MNLTQASLEETLTSIASMKDAAGRRIRAAPTQMIVHGYNLIVFVDAFILDPWERARLLFNAGHRGPWQRGFWRKGRKK